MVAWAVRGGASNGTRSKLQPTTFRALCRTPPTTPRCGRKAHRRLDKANFLAASKSQRSRRTGSEALRDGTVIATRTHPAWRVQCSDGVTRIRIPRAMRCQRDGTLESENHDFSALGGLIICPCTAQEVGELVNLTPGAAARLHLRDPSTLEPKPSTFSNEPPALPTRCTRRRTPGGSPPWTFRFRAVSTPKKTKRETGRTTY